MTRLEAWQGDIIALAVATVRAEIAGSPIRRVIFVSFDAAMHARYQALVGRPGAA